MTAVTAQFTTGAALFHELTETQDEKRLLRFLKQMASYELLIVDELGVVPLSKLARSCCSRCSACTTSLARRC